MARRRRKGLGAAAGRCEARYARCVAPYEGHSVMTRYVARQLAACGRKLEKCLRSGKPKRKRRRR